MARQLRRWLALLILAAAPAGAVFHTDAYSTDAFSEDAFDLAGSEPSPPADPAKGKPRASVKGVSISI